MRGPALISGPFFMKDKIIKRQNHPAGMTLIEIMIVIAMIAGIMAMATFVMFPGDDAKVREQASRLAGTIKFIYNEAAIKNKYYRLAYNLDENTYRVESSSEPFYVSIEGEEEAPKPTTGSEEGEGEEGEEGTAAGGEEGEGAAPPAFASEDSFMLKPVKFPNGVKIKDIFVMHSPERKEVGIVYSYFLPNGWAEPVIINLSDEAEESFYSLEVNPLTGKSKIRTEYLEVNPESFRKEDSEGE